MRQWLKRFIPPRTSIEKRWFLRPFAASIMDHRCWTLHRENVARAFALGLFIAFIPLPVHLLLVGLLGIWLRLNLPVLFATVFVSNPITWVPQIGGSIWVGAKILGIDLAPLSVQFARHWLWDFKIMWAPLVTGSIVLGAIAALLGYMLVQSLWRARVSYLLRRRRARSRARVRAIDQNSIR
jgi:uncharacterized protein